MAVGTSAGFAPAKECFRRSRWFGKRHKTDAFTKLGEPTITAAYIPQTVLCRWVARQYCLTFQMSVDVLGKAETSAEAWFNIALRPRKPEGSLGRTAQDGHLDSHTAPELCA